MKIYIIAQIVNGKNVVGYRLLDVDSKNEVKDYTVQQIAGVLSNPSTANIIQNAKMVGGKITGTNGQLSRYPVVSTNGTLISSNGESPLIVINKIDDVGYTVSDFKGQVQKMKNSDVVEYAKKAGIANGKIVIQDNVEYISSISDSYERISLTPSKVGKRPSVNINIHIDKDSASVAKHTETDIDTELQYNDVFSAMTTDQRNVLKQFYTWYTVDVYEGLAKNVRLNLAPGKAEKLAQLRGIDKWKFAGVNDSYLEGRFDAKCELGHNLRYEYFAIPEDDTQGLGARTYDYGYRTYFSARGAQDELRDNGAIVFGETCVSDFFNIATEDMKKLVKTRKTMSDEIELLADVLANKKESEIVKKSLLLANCIKEMGSSESVVKAFGQQIGYALLAFIKVQLPFPRSLVLLAAEKARENKEESKQDKNAVHSIYNTKASNPGLKSVLGVLDYVLSYPLEGEYQYNPLKDEEHTRRDVGAYNKKTRNERLYLNRVIYSSSAMNEIDMTVDNIKSYIWLVGKSMSLASEIDDYIDSSVIIQEKLKNVRSSDFVGYINTYSNRLDNVSDDEIVYFDVLRNILSFSNKYSRTNNLTYKSRTYYSYRAASRYISLSEIIEAYNNTVIKDGLQEFLNKTIGKIEGAYKGEIEKAREIELNTPKYYCIYLKEGSESVKALDELPCIYKDSRETRQLITDIMNKKAVDKDTLTVYGDFTINIADIDTVENIDGITFNRMSRSVNFGIEQRRREEEIRKEKERQEKERIEQEAARLKAEQEKAKAEEERAKAEQEKAEQLVREFESDETMQKLKSLLDSKPESEDDYGTTVARNILSRKIPFSQLSSKQQWRVNETIRLLSGDTSENQVPTKHKLSDNPEVKDKVDKLYEILDGKDKSNYDKVVNASRLAFDIVRTVRYKGEYSDKQLKHIEKAYEAIK